MIIWKGVNVLHGCEYFIKCQNNEKCLRCNKQSLLKVPKQKYYGIQKKSLKINDTKDKPWEKLEKNVANILNDKSRRTRASGALPFEKGDVLNDLLFIECKSRKGIDIRKGTDKSLSVSKEWLTKAQKEAESTNKPLALPFQFADEADDINKIYVIVNIHDLADMVATIKQLRTELADKNAIIKKHMREK